MTLDERQLLRAPFRAGGRGLDGGAAALGYATGLGLARVRLLAVSTPHDREGAAAAGHRGHRGSGGAVPDRPGRRARMRRIAAADQLLAEVVDLPPADRRRFDVRAASALDQVLGAAARIAELARDAGAAEAARAAVAGEVRQVLAAITCAPCAPSAAAVDVRSRPAVTTVRRRPTNRRSRLSHPSRCPLTQRTTLTAAAGGNARGRYTHARQ